MAPAYLALLYTICHISVIEALLTPRQPCLATSIVRGPCHNCLCTTEGLYHCREVQCRPNFTELIFATQCQPLQVYQAGNVVCECTSSGRWRSENCQTLFKFMQTPWSSPQKKLRVRVSCMPLSLYVIGCNVCLCPKNGLIHASKCTDRRCFKGNETAQCHFGDLLRRSKKLCACTHVGIFVDNQCSKIGNKPIQEVKNNDLASIVNIERSWLQEECTPQEKYWIDCNNCTCDKFGSLQCTNNECVMPELEDGPNRRRMNARMLPELRDENQPCTPGNTYRVHSGGYWNNTYSLPEIKKGEHCVKGKLYKMECNTCHCVEENSLVCTKMGCLHPDDLEKLAVNNKDVKKGTLRTGLSESPKGECVPGKFYKKGCKKCFCEANKKQICSTTDDCKELNARPVSPASFRSYTTKEFQKLPALQHQASACKAGVTYRIDCNSCFCLASGNLYCEKLLCPSYDDVNRLKAKDLNGLSCKKGDTQEARCVQCSCINNKLKCVAEPDCVPIEGRKHLHGPTRRANPREFLDLKKEECMPGMVYREGCNKCYCQTDQSVRCTQKTCLNFSQMVRLKKLRLRLEKEGL